MSEFIATAQVRILPDTTLFRARLQEEVNRAISQAQFAAVQVPVALGGGLAGAAASSAALATQQRATAAATAELTGLAQVENTTFARQAVILKAATEATIEKGASDTLAATAASRHAVAQGQVGKAALASTAGMLGLRGAVLTAGSAFIAATVGFQALGKAVGSSIEFEKQLNVFRVTAEATAAQMEQVSQTARDLGRDITLPGVAAGDAAQTLTELSKAGLSVQESLDAARGTLQLATAAQIDNAQAAELVANSLNAFQLEGTKATNVADLLAGAANASQGSITDMGLALKQAAAVARLTGLSVEETVTLLTELARAGLSASDAGTSLRTTLLRLVGDFPKVQQEVARLGLQLRDVNGNVRPEFFSELGQRLQKMAPAARQATVALLGGSDAIRAIGILSRSSAAEFEALQAQISKTGTAQEVAAAQTQGLGGDVEAAKNQFADLGLTVGNVASGPLGLFVRTAGAAAGAVNEMNTAVADSAGGGGFFSTFGDLLDGIQDSFSDLNISFQQGVRNAQALSERFGTLDAVSQSTTTAINGLADALERAGRATLAKQGLPDTGLNVKQVLNRLAGFDAEEVRARITGNNDSILASVESTQQFLIEQLDRQFVKNRPALRRALENALLGATNDITSISKQGEAAAKSSAAAAKSAALKAAQAIKDADTALLDALGQRREDAQRRIGAAGDTPGLQDDIRRQNAFQALIKIQIQKIRARVKDEEARRDAIRELRIASIASRKEEDALRQQQIEDAAARKDDIQNLNIQIAEARGNTGAIETAINARITTLNKQIKAAKGDQLKTKQLILERERLKEQLRELKKTQEDVAKEGKSAGEKFFNFLQTQTGFASNLLGNLIPGFATAGLVGGSATAAGPAQHPLASGVDREAAIAGGKDRGVRPVQVDTTNALLRQILAALNGRHTQPPEIRHNRATGSAVADTL